MSGWIAMNRTEESERLQERHPTAFLLACQVARRARWQHGRCAITGLDHGQAMVGDWKRAGLKSEKSYVHAKMVLQRAGLVEFRGTNRGTVATLMDARIFQLDPTARGEQTVEQEGRQRDRVKGERKDRLGASKKKERSQTEEGETTIPLALDGPAGECQPDPIEDAVAEIWEASHPMGRKRSSKKEIRHELRQLRKDGMPPPGTFRRSLEVWKASDEWTRDGGQYIPAVHRWISARKWEISEGDLRSTVTADGRRRLSKEEIIRLLGGRAYDDDGNLSEDLRE